MVVLHGASGNAARVELRYHWDPLSDRDGFFVVYPQGLSGQWNASLAPDDGDDVQFLTALLESSYGPCRSTRIVSLSPGCRMAGR